LKNQPLVSIIIRTKNEERWIASCLGSVYKQNYKNFEVILVDNKSNDQTVNIAKKFPIKLVEIEKFLPGKAINDGIRASHGEYIVCLSGHCIPTSVYWLQNLVEKLDQSEIAGVYGRQEPLSYSNNLDKRDLLTVFGLDSKMQIKDSFFHNANSAITRNLWNKFPFDEEVTNVEDRVWGVEVIKAGYKIYYEPEASVYHWHGINHGLNEKRARNIVNILENLEEFSTNAKQFNDYTNMNTIAIIPIRGKSLKINGKYLLEYTIETLKKSQYIKDFFVVTDCQETSELSLSLGAKVPCLRPSELSEDYVDVLEVIKFMLKTIEDENNIPDLVCCLEETYPFRDPQLIDNMISHIIENGLETLIAAKLEMRGIWLEKKDNYEILNNIFIPRNIKKTKSYVGLFGLCCITHPSLIRNCNLFESDYGIYEVNNQMSSLNIRNVTDAKKLGKLLDGWWNSYYLNS